MAGTRMRLASFCGALLAASFAPRVAHGDTILNLGGRVGLGDSQSPAGVSVKLQVDLDRNGTFDSFETVTATADPNGAYTIAYALDPGSVDVKFVTFVAGLLAKYQAGGFDALVGNGPLPMAVTFEQEGYSTMTKRLSTMLSNPSLDAMLSPLSKVGCVASGCQSANGDVSLSGFPGGTGITHAYAKAYDPRNDGKKFPGAFADANSSLLVSSGFTEIDLRDGAGNRVHTITSPVAVRYRLDPNSWPTIVDLAPGTGKIEVPMYSFDASTAQWVSQGRGELQSVDGKAIDESKLPTITGGTFSGDVLVSFQTTHFSSWNVDRPVQTHTCVKGRLVDQAAKALAGLQVHAAGVTYTGTTASITTGADGFFVVELIKSELPGEDVDGNGKTGETQTAKLEATGSGGSFTSGDFTTPTAQHSVGQFGSPACQPAACDCEPLPDTQVTIEPPRACTVTVATTYSGNSTSGMSPLAAGSAVVGASITGELTAGGSGFVGPSDSICQGQSCNAGTSDAAGNATFVVPVAGAAPRINLSAKLDQQVGTDVHYFAGSAVVDGCAAGQAQVVATVQLGLDHAQLSAMGSFIAALGGGPSPGGSGSGTGKSPLGCVMGTDPGSQGGGIFIVVVLGGATIARRRRRKG